MIKSQPNDTIPKRNHPERWSPQNTKQYSLSQRTSDRKTAPTNYTAALFYHQAFCSENRLNFWHIYEYVYTIAEFWIKNENIICANVWGRKVHSSYGTCVGCAIMLFLDLQCFRSEFLCRIGRNVDVGLFGCGEYLCFFVRRERKMQGKCRSDLSMVYMTSLRFTYDIRIIIL